MQISRIFVLIITSMITNAISAQNNADPAGMYALGSSNPEGGSHLLVFESGEYAITYFGGMQCGHWERKENKLWFTPNAGKKQFELYGRQDKSLSGQTRIQFNGFENGETFIHVGDAQGQETIWKRIFNVGANGFSHPYVHTFETPAETIAFMAKHYHQRNSSFFTFLNHEGYNDFIAYFAEAENESQSVPFSATFKEEKLYFSVDEFSQKTPFDDEDEDIEYIRELMEKDMNREVLYFNPVYNQFTEDINLNHIFNEEKGAYIDEEYYQEGEEIIMDEDSYDNMSFIYAFKALNDNHTEPVQFNVDDKPIFQVDPD